MPPLIVSHRCDNTQRIAALDRRAEALGLRPGLGIAEARAMHPVLDIAEADPEADARLLEALGDWCERYTPLVALDGKDGLLLDVTGCAHLFGGEQPLLREAAARLHGQGFDVRCGLASTPGAAWAAARHRPGTIVAPGEEAEFIAGLPLGALRLDAPTCDSLASVGLRLVGAVLAAPRAPLARRFGKAIALRIDQALGRIKEPISPRAPVCTLSAERHFADPVLLLETIQEVAAALARQVGQDLERRQEGARQLDLRLFRVDGAVMRVAVATSAPLRDPVRIGRLFGEKLAAAAPDIDAGYGFDLIRLSVSRSESLEARQETMGAETWQGSDMSLFVDRVRLRLGEGAIMRPVLVESHIPERAVMAAPFDGRGYAANPADPSRQPRRPVRLLQPAECIEVTAAQVPEGPPSHFRWRRVSYRVASAEGPERIAPEWWHAETGAEARDYFRVEDEAGRRYWIYRHGAYGGGSFPRWFLQGLFA